MRRLPPLLLCLAACAPEAPKTSWAPGQAQPATEPNADLLGGLGYASWDPNAEEEKSGVTLHATGKVSPGVNLFANDVDAGFAISMSGERLHEWRFPGRTQVEYFELLAGGSALAVSVDEGVTCVDALGIERWHADLRAHHDVAALSGGGAWVPVWEEHEYRGRRVRFDSLVRLGPGGTELERWSSFEARHQLAELHEASGLDLPATEASDAVYDYFHLNTVRVLAANARERADQRFASGNLLVCFRNVSLVCLLDASTREVLWHFGPGELDFPHFPTLTPAGNVLIFDNRYHGTRSRVLEIDPDTNQIVWEYGSGEGEAFFTKLRGSAQRLPNGNTLICESERGHAFEVTAEGERVWDFWNPEFKSGERRRIYRLVRVAEDVWRAAQTGR